MTNLIYLAACARSAASVAAIHADDVDRRRRFSDETIRALREEKLVWQLQDLAPRSRWSFNDSDAHPDIAWHGRCPVPAPDDLGSTATPIKTPAGCCLEICAARFAQAVLVEADGYRPAGDWVYLPQAAGPRVALRRGAEVDGPPRDIAEAFDSRKILSIEQHL